MEKYSIPASARALKSLAELTCKDQARPALTCVHVSRRGNACMAEATDSYRLARFSWECDAAGGDFDALFSRDALKALKVGEACAVAYDEDGAAIITGGGLRIDSAQAVRYPDVDRILCKDGAGMSPSSPFMCVNPSYLASVCKPVEAWKCPVAVRSCKEGAVFVHAEIEAAKNGNAEIGMSYDALVMPVRGGDDLIPLAWKDAERAHSRKEAPRRERAELQKPAEEAPKPEVSPEVPKVSPEAPEISPSAESVRAVAEGLSLEVRETSLCVWVSGDTKPHAAELKAAGAKWSRKKSAWYFRKEDAAA